MRVSHKILRARCLFFLFALRGEVFLSAGVFVSVCLDRGDAFDLGAVLFVQDFGAREEVCERRVVRVQIQPRRAKHAGEVEIQKKSEHARESE